MHLRFSRSHPWKGLVGRPRRYSVARSIYPGELSYVGAADSDTDFPFPRVNHCALVTSVTCQSRDTDSMVRDGAGSGVAPARRSDIEGVYTLKVGYEIGTNSTHRLSLRNCAKVQVVCRRFELRLMEQSSNHVKAQSLQQAKPRGEPDSRASFPFIPPPPPVFSIRKPAFFSLTHVTSGCTITNGCPGVTSCRR